MAHPNTARVPTSPQTDASYVKISVCHGTSKRLDEQEVILRSTEPMWILMDKVCNGRVSSRDAAQFYRDGQRINKHDTPESLQMEDGDKIDFYKEQRGGRDNTEHLTEVTPEKIDVCENIQSPSDVTQNQTGLVEDGQLATQEKSGLTKNDAADKITQAYHQTPLNRLSVRVVDESGDKELICTLKPDILMRKVMLNSCARLGIQWDWSCLVHAGRPVSPDDTPASLQLKNGEQLKLQVELTRGSEISQADAAGRRDSEQPGRVENIPAEKSIAAYPQASRNPLHVKIRVVDDSGRNALEALMGADTPMGKLMSHVCERWGIAECTARFATDGHRIVKNETPSMLEMINGDEIQMFREQHGGEPSQSIPQVMDRRAKQIAILPIRLNSKSVERGGVQDEDTQMRGQEPSTDKSPMRPLRSSRRSLDIHVSFAGSDHLGKVTFRLETHTPMRKVMHYACEYLGFSESDRFFYEGMRLNRNDTPFTLMMEDGDQIDVYGEQVS